MPASQAGRRRFDPGLPLHRINRLRLSIVKTPFALKIKILAASAGKLRIHDYSTISHGSLIQSSLKNRTEPAMRRHNSIVSYQNAKPVRISAR
jgi:hypothetical protein